MPIVARAEACRRLGGCAASSGPKKVVKRKAAHRMVAGLLLAGVLCGSASSAWSAPPGNAPAKPPILEQGAEKRTSEAGSVGIPDDVQKALAAFNRGAALMEQYEYSKAARSFEQVLKVAPDWTAARFNLGLAYLNMQEEQGAGSSLKAAGEAFEAVLKAKPKDPYATYALGLLYQHLGENEKAQKYFEAVHQQDPGDQYAAYKYAETLIALGRGPEATSVLEKIVADDPGFVSAVYRLANQYQRSGQREKAKGLFDRFRELNAAELAGGSFTVQKTYGTAGKYYMVLGPDALPAPPPQEKGVSRLVFSPEVKSLEAELAAWKWAAGTIAMPGVAVADVDGDGDLDLCLTSLDGEGQTSLWFNDGRGQFRRAVSLASNGVSPCFGDLDNDGDLDLWLGGAGFDALMEGDGKGGFGKAAAAPPAAGADLLTGCARLVDLDCDGDLDLVALRLRGGSLPATEETRAGGNSVYINNRDGSFTDAAEKLGLALPQTPVGTVVYDDLDNDRDLDLVVFPIGSSPLVWVNDRVGKYHLLDAKATGLDVADAISATSADANQDGRPDLLVFSNKGARLYMNRGGLRFEASGGTAERWTRLGGSNGQFADMDNDGDLDLVIADAQRRDGTRGPAVLLNDWPRERFVDSSEVDPRGVLGAIQTKGNASCVAADFTGDGKCDLLLLPIGEKPLLIANATQGGHWIALDLVGMRPGDNKARSNHSAIGARVELKTGRVLGQRTVGTTTGPVTMPPLRVHFGLGEHTKVDWLRIVWPDGVLQAELELPGDQVTRIAELPRKTSSCPHLFAWDGSRYQFVADFGGVGGLGYLVAPGAYAPPDPTEYLRLPPMEPRDGHYVLQVLEPLEEVVYFDEAKLLAVDHPVGTEVYPNEMMAVGVAPPKFEVFCHAQAIDPLRAVDHRGADVTDQLLRVDRRYAGATQLDDRFTGLAQEHYVELDFGDRLKAFPPEARLVLFLQGWVEYGYSSTNLGASQARISARAPSLSVLRDGKWVELLREVGYPAGLQHTMTLEVTGKILPSDRKIRISSNMELFWDRIYLARHEESAKLWVKEVATAQADLHGFGYPREYSPDGRLPNLYDYGNVDSTAPWKLMAGQYTRFGEVGELLGEADDCYVIMGRGEELTLRFSADAFGPIRPGCHRTFLLKTDSYCKDMDLATAHPDTVEPLPFHGMSAYPYGPGERYPENAKTDRYRRQYNTRQVSAP